MTEETFWGKGASESSGTWKNNIARVAIYPSLSRRGSFIPAFRHLIYLAPLSTPNAPVYAINCTATGVKTELLNFTLRPEISNVDQNLPLSPEIPICLIGI